jgi:hypothetical protein
MPTGCAEHFATGKHEHGNGCNGGSINDSRRLDNVVGATEQTFEGAQESTPCKESLRARACCRRASVQWLLSNETSRAFIYADLRAELARVRVRTLVMQGDVELSVPIEITGRRRPP